MAVNLYTLDELKNVSGLYADKALAKMDGSLDIYSTLLDKFLNQMPRTIPRLKKALREKKMTDYAEELKGLRIDLADIFALGFLERANIMYETALKGDVEKCKLQLDPFIQAVQTFAYEIKQCRTQEELENSAEAASKAAELDIGSSVVNNKYATVNKAKFVDLFNRINNGLPDKALNLANVLKAMGYDAEITNLLMAVASNLSTNKVRAALNDCKQLLILLGCPVPEILETKSLVMLLDMTLLSGQVKRVLGDEYDLCIVKDADEALEQVKSPKRPDFILYNCLPVLDSYAVAAQIKRLCKDIPSGFIFSAPTSQDILKARELGACEFFILPLDESMFLEKLAKYKHQ